VSNTFYSISLGTKKLLTMLRISPESLGADFRAFSKKGLVSRFNEMHFSKNIWALEIFISG
jgi:hypothetical protein